MWIMFGSSLPGDQGSGMARAESFSRRIRLEAGSQNGQIGGIGITLRNTTIIRQIRLANAP
jgi:hypothetical protein